MPTAATVSSTAGGGCSGIESSSQMAAITDIRPMSQMTKDNQPVGAETVVGR